MLIPGGFTNRNRFSGLQSFIMKEEKEKKKPDDINNNNYFKYIVPFKFFSLVMLWYFRGLDGWFHKFKLQ